MTCLTYAVMITSDATSLGTISYVDKSEACNLLLSNLATIDSQMSPETCSTHGAMNVCMVLNSSLV